MRFKEESKKNTVHLSFHSLRDFYWVIKYIGRNIKIDKNKTNLNSFLEDNKKMVELIFKSIDKNFSGMIYKKKEQLKKKTRNSFTFSYNEDNEQDQIITLETSNESNKIIISHEKYFLEFCQKSENSQKY